MQSAANSQLHACSWHQLYEQPRGSIPGVLHLGYYTWGATPEMYLGYYTWGTTRTVLHPGYYTWGAPGVLHLGYYTWGTTRGVLHLGYWMMARQNEVTQVAQQYVA